MAMLACGHIEASKSPPWPRTSLPSDRCASESREPPKKESKKIQKEPKRDLSASDAHLLSLHLRRTLQALPLDGRQRAPQVLPEVRRADVALSRDLPADQSHGILQRRVRGGELLQDLRRLPQEAPKSSKCHVFMAFSYVFFISRLS